MTPRAGMRLARTMTLMAVVLSAAPRAEQPAYRDAVQRYRESPNEGVERMLALAEPARAGAIDEALGAAGEAAWSADDLSAAAMMHTDAAFYFLSRKEPGLPHLHAAERFAGRVLATDPTRAAFVRRWYLTTERILNAYGDKAAATLFSTRLRDRLKDRPQTLRALDRYRAGVVDELAGCEKGEFLTIAGLTDLGGHHVQRYFVPAARALEEALSLEPSLAEASLHLGRIRMLEGNYDEAVRLFDQASRSTMRSTQYLALLFRGSLEQRGARLDAAEAFYRRANATFPQGQSASLALAQLLDRTRRAPAAATLLERMVARTATAVIDPWWTYFDEARPAPSLALRLLRAETSK